MTPYDRLTATDPVKTVETLCAENQRLRTAAIHIYNSGYKAGHHDTVEGGYVDIHSVDMDSYHEDEVTELLDDLTGSMKGSD